MPNLDTLYSHLLVAPDVPETIQRRAVEVFCSKRKGNSNLAEAIFNSPNLPAELADRVCEHGGPKELALWLAMEGRTKEEITARLKKEKRVTVLSSVADRSDLPLEVYENLIKASRNPKVLIRLIENEALDVRVRTQAAIKAFNSSSADRMMTTLVKAIPEESLSDIVLKVDSFNAKLRIATNNVINEDAKRQVLSIIVGRFADAHEKAEMTIDSLDMESQTNRYYRTYLPQISAERDALSNMASYGAFTNEEINMLVEAIDRYVALIKTHPQANASQASYFQRYEVDPFLDLIEVLKVSVAEIEPIDITCDRETLVNRASEVAAITAPTTPLALDIIFHPEADADIADMVYRKVSSGAARDQTLGLLLKEGRYEYVADLVIRGIVFSWLSDEIIAAAQEPTEFIRVFLERYFAGNQERMHYAAQWALVTVLGSKHLTSDQVKELPVEVLSMEGLEWTDTMRSNISGALLELLGDDEAHWSVFETLVNDGGLSLETAASTATLL